MTEENPAVFASARLDGTRIEYSLRTPYPSRSDIENLCRIAVHDNVRAVLLPGSRLLDAAHFLNESNVKLAAAIGFPFGAPDPDVKRYEAEAAVDASAHELELLPSIGRLKDGDYKFVLREIRDVVEAADERVVKVVIEATLWPDAALREITQMVLDSGAQYLVLASTPLSADSAALVAKLRDWTGPDFGLKAAAHNTASVSELLAAGANLAGLTPARSAANA